MGDIRNNALNSPTLERGLVGSVLAGLFPLNKAIGTITDDLFDDSVPLTIWKALKASNRVLSASEIIEFCKREGVVVDVRLVASLKLEAMGADVEGMLGQLMDYRDRRYLAKGVESAFKDVTGLEKSGVEVASYLKHLGVEVLDRMRDSGGKHDIFDTVQDIRKRMDKEDVPLLSTGISGLDKSLSGGWELGTLNVIGGRSGSGKTAFAMFVMRNGFRKGKEVGFISMEMTDRQMDRRELAMETGIPYHYLKNGELDDVSYKRIVNAADMLNGNRFYRTSCGQLDVDQLRVEIAKMVHVHGIKYIFIDYLQRIRIKQKHGNNVAYEIANLCSAIKGICIEYNICIVLLSQLNRSSVVNGKERMPTITDLRDSGGIEENMDSIILVHKPKSDDMGMPIHNKLKVLNVKNRDGDSNDEIDLRADFGVNLFYEEEGADAPF